MHLQRKKYFVFLHFNAQFITCIYYTFWPIEHVLAISWVFCFLGVNHALACWARRCSLYQPGCNEYKHCELVFPVFTRSLIWDAVNSALGATWFRFPWMKWNCTKQLCFQQKYKNSIFWILRSQNLVYVLHVAEIDVSVPTWYLILSSETSGVCTWQWGLWAIKPRLNKKTIIIRFQ